MGLTDRIGLKILSWLGDTPPVARIISRLCPNCALDLDVSRSIREIADFDFFICKKCGSASIWSGNRIVAGIDTMSVEGSEE